MLLVGSHSKRLSLVRVELTGGVPEGTHNHARSKHDHAFCGDAVTVDEVPCRPRQSHTTTHECRTVAHDGQCGVSMFNPNYRADEAFRASDA